MASSLTPTGIAFDRGGPAGGAAVVLIHAGVADRRMWDPQWAGLTASHDALRMDLHGFGESDAAPVGALDPVVDVLDRLDHLAVTSCHLVGSSLGAGVSLEVAFTRPGLGRTASICRPLVPPRAMPG